ncbi:class I SAM-dependent methyltransferase [Streptomyces sp. NBC_00433]
MSAALLSLTAPPVPGALRDPYALAVQNGRGPLYLRGGGDRVRVPVERWCALPDAADESMLERCRGLTLDVGCGPGRLTAALGRRGVLSLGVDIAPSAAALTAAAGGTALCRSVFERLPVEGRWNTVLLADGNIGIGGDPARLLRRCGRLIDPRGVVVVEVEREEVHERFVARFEDAEGRGGPPFPWARSGAAAVDRVARANGLAVEDRWTRSGRRFLALRKAVAR